MGRKPTWPGFPSGQLWRGPWSIGFALRRPLPMSSQWQNFLQNLGEWRGSFTGISPSGAVLKDTPSLQSPAIAAMRRLLIASTPLLTSSRRNTSWPL